MLEETIPAGVRPGSARQRGLAGAGAGLAVGAAVVAIIGPIAIWGVRSVTDFTSRSLIHVGVVASATGLCVLALVVTWLLRRYPVLRRPRIFAGWSAVALGAWSAWNAVDLYQARGAWPFVDSTGVSVVAGAAAVASTVAMVVALATVAFGGDVSGRAALCAFLVVVVGAPAVTYWAVQNHQSGVWYPTRIAGAAAPAPIPDMVGPVGYRITLNYRGRGYPDIYPAGNGFLIDTGRALTAYDGSTGEQRWRISDEGIVAQRWRGPDYSDSGKVVVAHRDRDDATGIVVVFLADGLIALDASSGEVLWRRQLEGGKVTGAAGSLDVLGMSVFTGDYGADGDSGTRLYSLDPATGRLRWSQVLSCSSPSLRAGAAGQLSYGCGKPAIVDARTGNTITVPGSYLPWAGTDAYVVADWSPDKEPSPEDMARVMDSDGKIIDEVPGVFPASAPHNGFLLVYGRDNTWLLRDYRNHRSTPVSIHFDPPRGVNDGFETIWLNNKLLVTNVYNHPSPLLVVDPERPADNPSTTAPPCSIGQGDLHAVAGAVVVQCGATEVVGLVPAHA
ncbi:PQQ-binding-like beta-propeller repeat protein [Mycolicibacterium senegalense]